MLSVPGMMLGDRHFFEERIPAFSSSHLVCYSLGRNKRMQDFLTTLTCIIDISLAVEYFDKIHPTHFHPRFYQFRASCNINRVQSFSPKCDLNSICRFLLFFVVILKSLDIILYSQKTSFVCFI